MAGAIVAIVVVVFLLILFARTIRIVPQARAGVVERFGRYSRTLNAGLAIVVPFVDRIRQMVDLRREPNELKQKLAQSLEVQRCAVQKWLTFANGEQLQSQQDCIINDVLPGLGLNCPFADNHGHDADFGQQPALIRDVRINGRHQDIVAICQKSGVCSNST